ncbi:unnamed protein product [Commensalibacter communis]|nr:unnamed protein product [Commensalibacter communis]CAI3931656.1 unnamed protein product [Commensalibacter communis]
MNNSEIYYMNDSALNFSICINGKDMFPFIKWIVETIPLHHYFFDLTGHWCLAITMEGYVDIGFSVLCFIHND